MYFRTAGVTGALSLILICVCMCLPACAKRNSPASQPISVKVTGAGNCLSALKNQMTRYTEGEASVDEVRTFWVCMQASIQKFEDLTSGDRPGGNYSPQALRQFIEHYFYDGHIPDDVLVGIMHIKRILLAGSEKQVTRDELVRLRGLFEELKGITLTLQPHVRVLLRKDKAAAEPQVLAAANSFNLTAGRLGAWLLRQNQTLTFQQVSEAIEALSHWTRKGGKNTSLMTTFEQAAQIIPEAKSILIGGEKTAITGSDWPLLTGALGHGYFLFLAAANGFDENLDAALTRTLVPQGAAHVLDVLAQSARRHSDSQISLAEFKNLYTKLEQTDWLSESIKEPALTAATQWLFTRLLGDGKTPAAGLTLEHLARLHRLTDDWRLLLSQPDDSSTPLVQEFNVMLASSKAIAWDTYGRMIFPEVPVVDWNLNSRRHMIWPFTVLKLIKHAYVGDAIGLNADQATIVSQEVVPLLKNFGWMKSTDKDKIGRRILREADLFTLASNGDGILDINEATRYLAFVVASFRTAQVWLDTALTACPKAEPTCVRAQAEIPGSMIFAHMPRLQKAMSTWRPGEFTAYMKNAEQTILGAPATERFTTGDLLQSYQLFEYAEVFLETYDIDASDEINLQESTSAYEIYGPTLRVLLPSSDLGFFTFMFKYGKIHSDPDFYGGEILYNKWRWHTEEWAMSADRRILMNILAELAKFSSK